jgi:hypothetical protein
MNTGAATVTAPAADPASLQNLNDIVVPAAVAWWPLAPGWYALGLVLTVLAVWWAARVLQKHHQNRYRRTALARLDEIRRSLAMQDESSSEILMLPELLKRTALFAFPRAQVASLSSAAWFQFLNDTVGGDAFSTTAAASLERLAYQPSGAKLSNAEVTELLSSAEHWLKQHRALPC